MSPVFQDVSTPIDECVFVGGEMYTVRATSREQDPRIKRYAGIKLGGTKEILLQVHQPLTGQASTLLHELIHAVEAPMPAKDELTEAEVIRLAEGLFEVLTNPANVWVLNLLHMCASQQADRVLVYWEKEI